MRIFFALWPPDEVRYGLFDWARTCQAKSEGRLVALRNLHATLAFLGEVDGSRLPELAALARASVGERFELLLDRVGYWPHNRIVYAGVESMPAPLLALQAELTQRLRAAAFRTEDRPYFAHVTLLRAAHRLPAEVRVEPLHWEVDALTLVESAREEGRVVYRPLQRWTLAD